MIRGEGMDWEFWMSRYKPVHTEWMNNKVLQYSTGNCIHYPVIEGGMNWKAETDTHTVLYRKWVANQDLLYSTGNAV